MMVKRLDRLFLVTISSLFAVAIGIQAFRPLRADEIVAKTDAEKSDAATAAADKEESAGASARDIQAEVSPTENAASSEEQTEEPSETSEDAAGRDSEAAEGSAFLFRSLSRAVGSMFGVSPPEDEEDEFLYRLGTPAPKFELESATGEKVRLEDMRGQVVLLDFWATWCGPCMSAMPELEKVQLGFAGKPVRVIGVNQQDELDAVRETVAQRGVTFTQVLDKDGTVGERFGASAIPHTVLIDQQGNIQSIHQGYAPGMSASITGQIDRLLRGENLYDKKKVSEARAKREQQRLELVAKLNLHDEDRLEHAGQLQSDQPVELSNAYSTPQHVRLPGEEQVALVLVSDRSDLLIVRPNAEQAEVVDLQWDEKIGIWDFSPVIHGVQVRWAVVGAEYKDDYGIKQFTLVVFDAKGKPVWKQVYVALDVDSYPRLDLAVGDLTGDDKPEIALLVKHDGLEDTGLTGPDDATRVLSVYDDAGEPELRAWIPGRGEAALYVLPESEGNTLLIAANGELSRFRVKSGPASQIGDAP